MIVRVTWPGSPTAHLMVGGKALCGSTMPAAITEADRDAPLCRRCAECGCLDGASRDEVKALVADVLALMDEVRALREKMLVELVAMGAM